MGSKISKVFPEDQFDNESDFMDVGDLSASEARVVEFTENWLLRDHVRTLQKFAILNREIQDTAEKLGIVEKKLADYSPMRCGRYGESRRRYLPGSQEILVVW